MKRLVGITKKIIIVMIGLLVCCYVLARSSVIKTPSDRGLLMMMTTLIVFLLIIAVILFVFGISILHCEKIAEENGLSRLNRWYGLLLIVGIILLENKVTNTVPEERGIKMSMKENGTIFCVKCGSELKYDAKFCQSCGNPVEELSVRDQVVNSNPVMKTNTSKKSSTQIGPIVEIVTGVICLFYAINSYINDTSHLFGYTYTGELTDHEMTVIVTGIFGAIVLMVGIYNSKKENK